MNKYVLILIFTFFVFSCSSDLDFKQTENLSIEPVVVSNLASFDLNANEFNFGGIPKTLFENVSNFDLFKKGNLKKNTTKIDFLFEINNTINQKFDVDLVFLDEIDFPLETIKIEVPAYLGVKNVVLKTKIFENNLDVLTNTQKIVFSIRLSQVTFLPNTNSGSLKFRSSVTGYFKVK